MLKAAIIAAGFALAACGGSSGPATHFTATLSGANEVPAKTTAATGTADYTVNGTTVNYTISFTGLTANATIAHIHAGAVGENGSTPINFTTQLPKLTAGSFTGSFTASDVAAGTSPGGVTVTAGSLDSLLTAMRAGNTYTNIHTSTNPGGEIRGQNQAQ
jgi:hypothetical protein